MNKLNTGSIDVPSESLRKNSKKASQLYRQTTDRLSTIQSDYEGIQQAIPFSNFDRFENFQAIKNITLGTATPLDRKSSSSKTEEDSTIICIEKSLNDLPREIIETKPLLRVLDISKNSFEKFPPIILQIPGLKSLRMDYNRLKSIP